MCMPMQCALVTTSAHGVYPSIHGMKSHDDKQT